MKRNIAVVVMLIAAVYQDLYAQASLRERVKASGGDYATEIRAMYPRVAPETLVLEAEAIVIGKVVAATPIVDDKPPELHTDYQIAVERVVRSTSTSRLRDGDTLIVRKMGGATTVDGHNVVVSDPDFPPFNYMETYVLFLESVPSASHFRLRYGGQGAFRVTDGVVRQASLVNGDWNETRGSVALDAFVNEVRQVTAALPPPQ